MFTSIVYHYLVIVHHSVHDWNIWKTYYGRPRLAEHSAAWRRVYALLVKAGI